MRRRPRLTRQQRVKCLLDKAEDCFEDACGSIRGQMFAGFLTMVALVRYAIRV